MYQKESTYNLTQMKSIEAKIVILPWRVKLNSQGYNDVYIKKKICVYFRI